MSDQGDTRNDAGTDDVDLAAKVDRVERRQRKLFEAVAMIAQSNGALSAALTPLLDD